MVKIPGVAEVVAFLDECWAVEVVAVVSITMVAVDWYSRFHQIDL